MALNPSIRKVPIIGKDIYKIGQIYDIMVTPCSVDPMLWVYGFWHEIPYVFAMLLLPDPIDFVQERFGTPHHKKRRYKGKAKGAYKPDISPGKGLGWAAWKMTEWIDRVGWYLLIADVSINFAFNWSSLVYQWSGCPVPGTPYCCFYGDRGLQHAPGDWTQADSENKGWYIFRQTGLASFVVPHGMTASFTMGLTVTPRPGVFPSTDVETRLVNLTTGAIHPLPKLKPDGDGNHTTSEVWRSPKPSDGDENWQFQFKNNGPGYAWIQKIVFAGYGARKLEGLIPWLGEVKF